MAKGKVNNFWSSTYLIYLIYIPEGEGEVVIDTSDLEKVHCDEADIPAVNNWKINQ